MSYTTKPVIADCIAYLTAHPEHRSLSARKLAAAISEPKASNATWYKARRILGLPALSRRNMKCAPKTPKQERKAAFAVYPNTHKIVVDVKHLKIIFHGDNGFKVTEKQTAKALAASLRLFRLAKFETKQHDLDTGIMILTLKAEALEVRQVA